MEIPYIRTMPPGPKGKEIVKRDGRYLATSTKTSPIVAKSAKGAIVEDVDGNLFLDFTSGIGVTNTGHCHPRVVEAVRRQAGELFHFAGTDFYYDIQVTLAERLCGIVPGEFEKKVFFTNSGTEATECAIKLTRRHTGKKQFIGFLGAFHGRTMGALSITASKTVQRSGYFPMMPGVTHVPYAYCYRCAYRMEYPECDLWCLKILEEVYFKTLLSPEEVAAIFFEPVQGEGGYVVPPRGYPRELARIAKRHDILLVDDEVQAGFGRTGKMLAVEHFGITPHVVTMAKGMGSGLPIGACVFDAKLDFSQEGAHSNTYGGNLVACASALATLEVIEDEKLLARAAKLGKRVEKRLDEMKSRFELIGDNRGVGLMQASEFVKDRKTKEPAKKERNAIVESAYKKGLILLPCGTSGIRYIPPLVIEEEHLDKGFDILEECIGKVAKG